MAVCVPEVRVADPAFNADAHLRILAGVHADVGDFGEVADDLTGLARHLGGVRGRAGAQAVEEALAPQAQRVGALRERRVVVGQQRREVGVVAGQRAHHVVVDVLQHRALQCLVVGRIVGQDFVQPLQQAVIA